MNDLPIAWPDPIFLNGQPACDGPVTGWLTAYAARILWGLTGRRFGIMTQTFRPCKNSCARGWYGWTLLPINPIPWSPGLYWYPPDNCGDQCGCVYIDRASLPSRTSAVTVKVDGATMDPSTYRIDGWNTLSRLDGKTWPACQDLSLDDSHVGTWSITATYGTPLPPAGQIALGEMISELAKAVGPNDSACSLPRNVRQAVRQGVTVEMSDPVVMFTNGLTGIPLVDAWIKVENPYKLNRRPRILHPERLTPRPLLTGTS